MAKNELDKVTQDALHAGGVLAKVYFDMQSEKMEDLQPLMTDLISDKLLKMPGVIYCVGEIAEPIKVENHYSTNAEATILTKDVAALINVCFHYTPLGIEIIKPEKEIVIRVPEMQSILLDLATVAT
ncbi:MAG: hypothetical protein KGH52_04530, partial [Candidatus Micrarchaeota archaeon]|nr:hypothetical protein [Candidatus Micrarchaeota archaeon]